MKFVCTQMIQLRILGLLLDWNPLKMWTQAIPRQINTISKHHLFQYGCLFKFDMWRMRFIVRFIRRCSNWRVSSWEKKYLSVFSAEEKKSCWASKGCKRMDFFISGEFTDKKNKTLLKWILQNMGPLTKNRNILLSYVFITIYVQHFVSAVVVLKVLYKWSWVKSWVVVRMDTHELSKNGVLVPSTDWFLHYACRVPTIIVPWMKWCDWLESCHF